MTKRESSRLGVGWELKKVKQGSEEPVSAQSYGHGHLYNLLIKSYAGLCMLVCLKQAQKQKSISAPLWLQEAWIQRMGGFWMNMWLVPVTSSLGWLSLVLVNWDGVADLQRHPSTISSPVLQLSKTVSASVIAVGWHLLQHTNMTKKTQAWALVPHFILAFLQPCKFLR